MKVKKQCTFCCVLGAGTYARHSCSPSKDDDDEGGEHAQLVEARVLETHPRLLQKDKTT